jgi:hypothetical protein
VLLAAAAVALRLSGSTQPPLAALGGAGAVALPQSLDFTYIVPTLAAVYSLSSSSDGCCCMSVENIDSSIPWPSMN